MVLPGGVVPVGEMDGTIPKASRSGWITKERGQRFPPLRISRCRGGARSVLAELSQARFCLKLHGVGIRSSRSGAVTV